MNPGLCPVSWGAGHAQEGHTSLHLFGFQCGLSSLPVGQLWAPLSQGKNITEVHLYQDTFHVTLRKKLSLKLGYEAQDLALL